MSAHVLLNLLMHLIGFPKFNKTEARSYDTKIVFN